MKHTSLLSLLCITVFSHTFTMEKKTPRITLDDLNLLNTMHERAKKTYSLTAQENFQQNLQQLFSMHKRMTMILHGALENSASDNETFERTRKQLSKLLELFAFIQAEKKEADSPKSRVESDNSNEALFFQNSVMFPLDDDREERPTYQRSRSFPIEKPTTRHQLKKSTPIPIPSVPNPHEDDKFYKK